MRYDFDILAKISLAQRGNLYPNFIPACMLWRLILLLTFYDFRQSRFGVVIWVGDDFFIAVIRTHLMYVTKWRGAHKLIAQKALISLWQSVTHGIFFVLLTPESA